MDKASKDEWAVVFPSQVSKTVPTSGGVTGNLDRPT